MDELHFLQVGDDRSVADWQRIHNEIIPTDPLTLDEVRERSGRNRLELVYLGDTAVGMHPVTAHGFNLGLSSADRLASMIRSAMRIGEDWSAASLLERYSIAHRRTALPIYRATNMIVRLYNDERPAAWAARHAAIRLGRRVPLVRTAVRSMLLRAS